tara:strand:+ start:81 stop:299 length:219 start_codon:yes stop_codon:yes gene_type:complete
MNTLNYHDEAIRRLADGFSSEFAEEVAADERFHELLMLLSEEFVAKNIPIVSEEDTTDVSYELMMRVTTKSV